MLPRKNSPSTKFQPTLAPIDEHQDLFDALQELNISPEEYEATQEKISAAFQHAQQTYHSLQEKLQNLKDCLTQKIKLIQNIGLDSKEDPAINVKNLPQRLAALEEKLERDRTLPKKIKLNKKIFRLQILSEALHQKQLNSLLTHFKEDLFDALKTAAQRCYIRLTQPATLQKVFLNFDDEAVIDLLTNPKLTENPINLAEADTEVSAEKLLAPLNYLLEKEELVAVNQVPTKEISAADKKEFNTLFTGIATLDEKSTFTFATFDSKAETLQSIALRLQTLLYNANTFYHRTLNYSHYNPLIIIKNELRNFSYQCKTFMLPIDLEAKSPLKPHTLYFEKYYLTRFNEIRQTTAQFFQTEVKPDVDNVKHLEQNTFREIEEIQKILGVKNTLKNHLFQANPSVFFPTLQPLLAINTPAAEVTEELDRIAQVLNTGIDLKELAQKR